MKIEKYHGLGNDFLITLDKSFIDDSERIISLCDRYSGIGADGFIPRIEDPDAFKKSIKQVQSGVKVYPADIQRSFDEDDYLLDKTYIDEVSIPEMHIGLFTSLGLSQKEISWNVGLSSSTVSEYTRKLRRKIKFNLRQYENAASDCWAGYFYGKARRNPYGF